MKKKFFAILLCAVMTVTISISAVACGDNKGGIKIMLLSNSAENQFYESHFAAVAEEMGITISYEGQASKDYYNKLSNEINGATVPDIFYIRPKDMKQFIADGLIAPIDSYVNSQTDVDISKIYPVALESYKYDKTTKRFGSGSLYAIPKDLSVQQLGYNKTLIMRKAQAIAAAGLKLPWEMDWETENYTWDEFKTLAALSADLSDERYPVYGCDVPKLEILAKSFGGGFLSEDMQNVTVDSTAVKDAIEFQAEMIRDGASNYQGATYANFVAGKVAFYGETNSFDIKNFDDNFAALEMEWDIMPWPIAQGQQPDEWNGLITSAGFAISSTCKDKETAVKVMLTLLSETTQDNLVRTQKLMLPLYKDVAEQAYCSSDYDDVYSPKSRKIFIDVISGKNGFFPVEYSTYDYLWYTDVFQSYLETIYAESPDTVMSRLKSDAEYVTLQNTMQASYNAIKNK